MSKQEALKAAEAYVLKHRPSFKKGATRRDIQLAVQKVARALHVPVPKILTP